MTRRPLSLLAAGVVCLLLTTTASAKTAEQYLQEARSTRDPAKLTQLYSLAIAAGIQDKAALARAYYLRGCAFFQLKRPGLALEDFDQAAKINPKAALYHQARGLACQKLNKTAQAAASFKRAAALGAGRPAPKPCQQASARPPSSPGPSARVKPSAPTSPPRRAAPPAKPAAPPAKPPAKPALTERQKQAVQALAKGLEAEQQGRLHAAHRLLSEAIRLGLPTAEKKFEAYLYRGKIRLLLRRRPQALSDLTLAVRFNPRSASARYLRGHAYYDMRIFRQAVAEYSRAIRLRPKMVKAYIGRGMAYHDLGQYQQAVNDYTRAIRLRPRDLSGYNLRGLSFLSLRRYHQALKDFNAALTMSPGSTQLLNNRGLAFHRLRRFHEALQDFNQALAKDPKSAVTRSNRGLVYMSLRRFRKAEADFSMAIKHDPRQPLPRLNRGDARLLQGRFREAIADYTRTLALLPKGGELSSPRVTGYLRQGQRGVTIEPNVVFYNVRRVKILAYKHRGLAYRRLGMHAQARADLERARRLQGL
jgi:tetratricopeptide (TPR) repeat protein